MKKAARKVIDYCIGNDIGILVVGYNETFQRCCHIGKTNNQNERIRSQRGIFVVVPNYILSDAMKQMKQYGKDIRAMNHQDICQDCM